MASSNEGWTSVAFGDVVRLSNQRSADPDADGFERYVGLEHLDPSDLKVRRWGDIKDGTTFTTVFKPGQVLFGKRRAYQRKVAVPDFTGVCSGDIYVLEPSNSNLLPELLPFICQTDAFYEHAVETSAGSLSPRTTWKSLATFEFNLPSLDEQRRIANVLGATLTVAEKYRSAEAATSALYRATGMRLFAQPGADRTSPMDWMRPGWQCEPLDTLVLESAPICYGIVQVGNNDPAGVPTLAIKDLRGDFSKGVHRTSASIEARYKRSRVAPGDLLISIKATIGDAAIVPEGFQGNIGRDVARLRLDADRLRPSFFLHLYQSLPYRRYVRSLLVGTTRAELSIATLRRMLVPLPSTDVQDLLVGRMDALHLGQSALSRRAQRAFTLGRGLLDDVIRGQHQ